MVTSSFFLFVQCLCTSCKQACPEVQALSEFLELDSCDIYHRKCLIGVLQGSGKRRCRIERRQNMYAGLDRDTADQEAVAVLLLATGRRINNKIQTMLQKQVFHA